MPFTKFLALKRNAINRSHSLSCTGSQFLICTMGYFKASNPWNSPYGHFSIGKNLLNACAEGHSLSKRKPSFPNLSNKLTPIINQHFLSHRRLFSSIWRQFFIVQKWQWYSFFKHPLAIFQGMTSYFGPNCIAKLPLHLSLLGATYE